MQRFPSLFWRPASGINWLWTFLMGAMWYGGVAVYGMAVMNLGHLGASIGCPVIQSTAVLSGNVVGLATGEWKGATGKPLQLMLAGLLLLVAGIAIIGWAGTQKAAGVGHLKNKQVEVYHHPLFKAS